MVHAHLKPFAGDLFGNVDEMAFLPLVWVAAGSANANDKWKGVRTDNENNSNAEATAQRRKDHSMSARDIRCGRKQEAHRRALGNVEEGL